MLGDDDEVLTIDEWMSLMARRRAGWLASDLAAIIDPVAAVAAGRDDLDRATQ